MPLNTGREPFIPVPSTATSAGPKEELLTAYGNQSGRSGGPPPSTDGVGNQGGSGPAWESDRAYSTQRGSSGVPVWVTVAVAVIVLVATLGVVWGTNGAGLLHANSTGLPAQRGRNYVTVISLTVVFTYNTSHQFLAEQLGACAYLDCPFLLENNTGSGTPGWSSFVLYVQDTDTHDWTNESAKIVGVSSSPAGIAQNGPGLALIGPYAFQFGVAVGVTYEISNPTYNVTVDIEGDWS